MKVKTSTGATFVYSKTLLSRKENIGFPEIDKEEMIMQKKRNNIITYIDKSKKTLTTNNIIVFFSV
ncbi:hypothetical protein TKV_c11340 [Thermoanaerobacter kivui]|uniref:Uncharacterized protein n=1 Tax=Thermoanaerobacter kivui TaxID=2325 RepID=A0A097AR56_THEKI|nr:hypothetical protein [Thermoanaerobacter kivui]AIS52306.1 hypothetical protein TKV_c11340 [Thermoanaerobacter kivui]